jgi:hypothetical protein
MLIMVTPVFANSSSWSFLAFYDRYYLSGKANGVFHNMTAGQLTNSGKIWVTMIMGGIPAGMYPWYFEVWKKNTVFDQLICTSSPVYPNVMVGSQYATSFTKSCGNISAGTYYLVIYRAQSDNREVQGSGTLHTP